jgi:hypothetical protein
LAASDSSLRVPAEPRRLQLKILRAQFAQPVLAKYAANMTALER